MILRSGLSTPLQPQTIPLNFSSTNFGISRKLRIEKLIKEHKEQLATRRQMPMGFGDEVYQELLTVEEFQAIYELSVEEEYTPEVAIDMPKLQLRDGREIPRKKMNTLKKKLLEEKTISLGVRITPSYVEALRSNLNYRDDIGSYVDTEGFNIDSEVLKQKAFLGELLHFFAFLVVYNYFLFYSKQYNLDYESVFLHFFSEFKSPIYPRRLNEEGRFDLSEILETMGKRKGENNESILEKARKVSLQIRIPREKMPVILRRSLEDLNKYLIGLEVEDDLISYISDACVEHELIAYGSRLCTILESAGGDIMFLDQSTRKPEIGVITEQPIIINSLGSPAEFYPESFSQPITLTNRKGNQEKIKALLEKCQQRFPGDYWIGDDNTIHINFPVKLFNMQLVCKPDLILFRTSRSGEPVAHIFDHKLSWKDRNSVGMKLNAFFYRLVAAYLIMNGIRSAGDPIMLNNFDIDHPDLEEFVVNRTKFKLVVFDSTGREQVIEILHDLDSFEYYQLKMQLKYAAETSVVYSDVLKQELGF